MREPSLMDVVSKTKQEWRIFVACVCLGMLATMAYLYLTPRKYVSSSTILPPQQQQSATANALAQIGAISGGSVAMKSPDEMYVALLRSRTLQERLIEKYSLRARYGKSSITKTRRALNDKLVITTDKKAGLITIDFEDVDAAFSAKMNNSMVEELRKLLKGLAVTEAQQRRTFYEIQLDKSKANLSKAEISFRTAQSENGLVVSQALAEAGIKESAQIKANIAMREVELKVLSQHFTDQHPQVVALHAEIEELSRQLDKLLSGGGASSRNVEKNLKAVEAYRNMKVQEAILELLIKQLENARADEAKEGPILQQIDIAVPPDEYSKPNIPTVLAIGLAGSMLIGVLASLSKRRMT
jgi:tyrosine-protein kinase Etk/Wzc